jgi:hypothetical protein
MLRNSGSDLPKRQVDKVTLARDDIKKNDDITTNSIVDGSTRAMMGARKQSVEAKVNQVDAVDLLQDPESRNDHPTTAFAPEFQPVSDP